MKLSLIALGRDPRQAIPVTLSPYFIGRNSRCHLRPQSLLVSNRHCEIMVRDDKAFLRDLDSTNGTQLNGRRLAERTELHDHDRMQVGPLVFEVCIHEGTSLRQSNPLAGAATPENNGGIAQFPASAALPVGMPSAAS